MRNKKKLTETLVAQLDPGLGLTYDFAIGTWWFNRCASGGMRLSEYGYRTFTEWLEIEHYDYDLKPFDLDSRLIVLMGRRLQHPYYIVFKKQMPSKIIFFGSKEAMMANLYGDIRKFIDNYQV